MRPFPRAGGPPQRTRRRAGQCPTAPRSVGLFYPAKTTDDASHPERRDQDAERIACAVLGQAELVHHRLLEHAPRRRQARQDLNGRPRRQDRPGVFCCKLLFHCLPSEWFFPYSVPISIDKTADSFIMDKVTTKHGLASPSSLRDATSPKVGGFGSPHKVYGFAKGSPFGRAGRGAA